MYYVSKTYDHNLGLSACFRQHRAKSHCRDPHGYPLSFRLLFAAEKLNGDNWVIDFGGLKPVKEWLVQNFDHRTVLAADDPALKDFQALYSKHNFSAPIVLPNVGCEAFAKYVFNHVSQWLCFAMPQCVQDRALKLVSVEVREHSANSAIYEGDSQ